MDGHEVSLKQFQDYKIIMIVNVASACGTIDEIKQFLNQIWVNFPVFNKIDVNGENASPLFQWLRNNSECSESDFPFGGAVGSFLANTYKKYYLGIDPNTNNIPWNFAKFVVYDQGTKIKYFNPKVNPENIEPFIQQILGIQQSHNKDEI
ncbi:Thioredoxin-like fold [Pseudocohnilembus persalinus]|uniref:Thioredoxin-like fold n=1 Tax=Pseudocohnilembus persalinus TaxID=266149 RepID=A0A0V0R4Z8_PSEPJ|nr:Thioredoxin-like fold [Pseudocohnilembus persalinus]|eukprot:KRX09424.1 Thioredoxin-like fold [Pseudocohnilembus persalinus]